MLADMPVIRMLFLASAACVLVPSLEAQSGSLEGQVVLSSRIAARRPRFRLYTEYGQGTSVAPPATAHADTSEMANVIIYLDSADLAGNPADSVPAMGQVNE